MDNIEKGGGGKIAVSLTFWGSKFKKKTELSAWGIEGENLLS